MSSVLEQLGSARRGEQARLMRLLIVGAVAFVVVLAGWLYYSYTHAGYYTLFPADLRVYRDGGLIVRQVSPPYNAKLQYPLYDWAGSTGLKFTYTPFSALFFAAVSIIPWWALPRLSQLANLIFLLLAAWFTMGALGYRDRRVRLGGALLGTAAGLLIEPVFRTIFLGQINLLLMAVVIWDLNQPEHRRWKGLGTGVAAGIKLIPLIYIPYLLLTRRFRAAAMVAGGFVLTIALGFAVQPGDSTAYWLHGLFFRAGRTGFVGWGGNQSLQAIITRLAGSINAGKVPWMMAALIVIVVGLLCAARFHRSGHPMLGLLTAALVGLLVSPVSWDHHWVWVAPGMMVAGHYGVRAWREGRMRFAFGCFGGVAAVLLIFAPWPGRLWGYATHGAGQFSKGILWAAPNSPVKTYMKIGDKPWFKEYHWHFLQALAGNAYVLTGIVLLILLTVAALRIPRRPADPSPSPPLSPSPAA